MIPNSLIVAAIAACFFIPLSRQLETIYNVGIQQYFETHKLHHTGNPAHAYRDYQFYITGVWLFNIISGITMMAAICVFFKNGGA